MLKGLKRTTSILLALLFIKLAFAVISKRRQHKVALGSGHYPDLESAIRAHGNFAEYVPLALFLLLCAELNRSYWWLLAGMSVFLVMGRYIHATAIAQSDIKKRVLGMQLTFASLAMGVPANVVPLVAVVVSNTKIEQFAVALRSLKHRIWQFPSWAYRWGCWARGVRWALLSGRLPAALFGGLKTAMGLVAEPVLFCVQKADRIALKIS